MPNWCYNNLTISVEKPKQLIEIIQGITGNSEQLLDFNRVIAIPEELAVTTSPNRDNPDEMKQKYGHPDWYSWRTTNWGTKWNASDVELQIPSTKEIYFSFSTAWSPPIPVIQKIAEQFPFASISLNYEEEGMGFWGKLEYEEGNMVTDTEGEIDCAYRWQTWGNCYPDCEDCGECDCEVCNCENPTQETLCKDCNNGTHNNDTKEVESE